MASILKATCGNNLTWVRGKQAIKHVETAREYMDYFGYHALQTPAVVSSDASEKRRYKASCSLATLLHWIRLRLSLSPPGVLKGHFVVSIRSIGMASSSLRALVILALVSFTSATPLSKRDTAQDMGFFDPHLTGGRMLTVSRSYFRP